MPTAPAGPEAAALRLEMVALAVEEAAAGEEVVAVVVRPCHYWPCMSFPVLECCAGHREEEGAVVVVVVVDLLLAAASLVAAASLAAATASLAAVAEAVAVETAVPDFAFACDAYPEAAFEPAFEPELGR